ncbi:VOC family protein [Streptomyces sp. NRRL F-5135]|uniref:VOC family protein n=1 Tax=Streptomyces sp. NRRL F-5135 TaxID=1463858 RepID=UPI0004C50D13|nr:VOC family protein [Streptomyces sp. NRRL F-5135]
MGAFAEGTPCWVDVSLPDLEAGKRFYGELFGWTFGPPGSAEHGRYTDALSGGLRVAGLIAKRDGRMPTAWGVHFATPDVVRTGRRIREAGGRLITDPVAVGTAGIMALAADPAGAVFGLWQARDFEGFEKKGLPGSFRWTEVYTRDKDRVDPFYESVFGFRATDLPGPSGSAGPSGSGVPPVPPGPPGTSVDFRTWSPAGTEPGPDTAIGGRSVITDAFPAEMPAHFLSYFAVADCDGTVAAAVRLGGRVTAPPFGIEHGRTAVLVDNQGASFAVLTDTEPIPKPHA